MKAKHPTKMEHTAPEDYTNFETKSQTRNLSLTHSLHLVHILLEISYQDIVRKSFNKATNFYLGDYTARYNSSRDVH